MVLPSSRIDVHPNLCCWDQNQENFARVNVGTTVFFDFFPENIRIKRTWSVNVRTTPVLIPRYSDLHNVFRESTRQV